MAEKKPIRRRRNRLANWIFFAVLIIAVGAISYYSYRQSKKQTKWTLQSYQSTESVYTGDLQMSVLASATLQPFEVVQVRPEASGKVVELFFDIGDWVNEGDPLVRLDQQSLLTGLETARAQLRQAQANLDQVRLGYTPREIQSLQSAVDAANLVLEQTQKNLTRIQQLHDRGFASDVDLDNAENEVQNATQNRDQAVGALDVALQGSTPEQIRAAEAAVEMARVAVNQAETSLGYSLIDSPMSGVVLNRSVSVGSVIVSNLAGFGGGDAICDIGDLSRMKAISSVDESDVGSVQPGQQCTLSVDAYPDEKFEGTLLKVHPQATLEGGVTTFITEVEVPNVDGRLMAGLSCEVDIITNVIRNVLLVPDRAIAQKNDRNFVFVVSSSNKIEAREIQIGETNYDVTQVLSGLQEGEQVIVRGVPSDLLDEVVKEDKQGEGQQGGHATASFSSSD